MPRSHPSLPQPFFEAAGIAPQAGRRLILLSPHFPPGQGAGALRWQKLAGFAAERGWGLDVLTVDPLALQDSDASRMEDLPAGTRVYGVAPQFSWIERAEKQLLALKARVARPRPRAASKPGSATPNASQPGSPPAEPRGWPRTARDWVRTYDAGMEYAREGAWARVAADAAARLFDPAQHRLVISCGPPHMTHEGGRRLARRCRVPLLVDMRDTWRLVEQLPSGIASPLWRRLAERYEPRVVASAALVVMNTPPARDAMRQTYPAQADRILAVLNGWDEEDLPESTPQRRFLVSFLGSIYLDRDPRPFFRAAGRVVDELRLTPDDFGIEFVGSVASYAGTPTADLAASEGLGDYLNLVPPVSRRRAMELQARAALLLNLPQSLHMAIPSKVYDYMRFPAWVLSLSDPGSATAWLLNEAGADVVAPADTDAIVAKLRQRVLQHRRGERPAPLTRDSRFARRAQAQRLFDAIERIVPG